MKRLSTRAIALLLVFAVVLSAPAGVAASDGEVLQRGNNIAGEVFMDSGRPRINFANLGDCPGINGIQCFVEVKFRHFCEEAWCVGWSETGWLKVPAGQDFYRAAVCADGRNKWEVKTRLHFVAANPQTIEFWGQAELLLSTYYLIAKFLFNASAGVGLRLGTKITTITASDAYAGESILGISNGFIQGPASC